MHRHKLARIVDFIRARDGLSDVVNQSLTMEDLINRFGLNQLLTSHELAQLMHELDQLIQVEMFMQRLELLQYKL